MVKNNKGITLIALVITIVVLVILSTIVVVFTIGNDGILNRASSSTKQYINAEAEEQVLLGDMETQINKHITSGREGETIKFNSVSAETMDKYTYSNFSISASGKKYISGESKFGTFDGEGNLVIEDSGLYTLTSSLILTNTASGQIYNRIYINDILFIYSFEQGDSVGAPVSSTVYLNTGDKIKIALECNNQTRAVYSWSTCIYKII